MQASELLHSNRIALREIISLNNASNARVFGSVISCEDSESNDLYILVEPTEVTTLFDLGAIQYQLKQLLGIAVYVVTPNALPDSFRATVLLEALPI